MGPEETWCVADWVYLISCVLASAIMIFVIVFVPFAKSILVLLLMGAECLGVDLEGGES